MKFAKKWQKFRRLHLYCIKNHTDCQCCYQNRSKTNLKTFETFHKIMTNQENDSKVYGGIPTPSIWSRFGKKTAFWRKFRNVFANKKKLMIVELKFFWLTWKTYKSCSFKKNFVFKRWKTFVPDTFKFQILLFRRLAYKSKRSCFIQLLADSINFGVESSSSKRPDFDFAIGFYFYCSLEPEKQSHVRYICKNSKLNRVTCRFTPKLCLPKQLKPKNYHFIL